MSSDLFLQASAADPATIVAQAAPSGEGLEAASERRLMILVAALHGASQEEHAAILQELATYGEAAVDMVIAFHEDGHFERPDAARLVSAIRDGVPEQTQAQASGTPREPVAQERTESQYRVVGVAAADVLNVRAPAGVSGTVVGMLPPDARGVELTGAEEHIDDSTWVEIADPALPGGRGWVNARFLEPEEASAAGADASPALTSQADEFVRAGGYEIRNPQDLEEQMMTVVTADPQSALVPGGELGPLTKAVLVLEAAEGELRHARYRIRYGMAMVDAPPAADPIPLHMVTVDRFNLGPQVRAQLAAAHGDDNVAPPEHYGVGPHVSYRLAMRPIMGRTADIVAASRAELPEPTEPCFGYHCLMGQGTGDHVADWGDMAPVDRPDVPVPYEEIRDGALTPAAAIDILSLEMGLARVVGDNRISWSGFEPREGVAPGEPFAEAIIELNFGQDQSVDAFMRDGEVMDHAIAAVWQRVASVAQGGQGQPLVFGAQVVEHRPGHE